MEILDSHLSQTIFKKGTIVIDKNNNYFKVGDFADGSFIMAHWHEGPIYEVAQEYIPLQFIDGIFIENKDTKIKIIDYNKVKEENFKIIVTSNE
jgi:hypothetical protein